MKFLTFDYNFGDNAEVFYKVVEEKCQIYDLINNNGLLQVRSNVNGFIDIENEQYRIMPSKSETIEVFFANKNILKYRLPNFRTHYVDKNNLTCDISLRVNCEYQITDLQMLVINGNIIFDCDKSVTKKQLQK